MTRTIPGLIGRLATEANSSTKQGGHIPTQRVPSATSPDCYRCEDTNACGECNGNGEFYTYHGVLTDCRECNGHGICLECTETEEECMGGYRCLCQLQETCVPVAVSA